MFIRRFLSIYYTLFFVWAAGGTALLALQKKILWHYRWFALLIVILSLLETVSNILAFNSIKNHFFFNYCSCILFMGTGLFYYHAIHNSWQKALIKSFLIAYPVYFAVNNIWLQGFAILNTDSYILGGCFILLFSVAYGWQLYTSDETGNIFADPVFWISAALFFYCSVSVPFIGMLNYLWNNFPAFTTHYYLVIYDLSLMLYNIFLITGFICMHRLRKQN